ncbi:MAG TPA: flavin reductase [Clostridiales bacterium]|jgi:flavin reductase (DIM6/NTAB) family NADH-FMN oxidoreductase RutF/rubredoxin|nr:flavin reductase [Clostridiales bacterium]
MDITALNFISCGVYITGVKNGDTYGGSCVDAFVQATSSSPPHIILCSMNGNFTTGLIRQNGEFSVSVLGQDVDPKIIANFGYRSGRDVNKWDFVEHMIKDDLPYLKDACAYLRCKVEDIRIMSTHNIITASVEDAWVGSGTPVLYSEYHQRLKIPAREALFELTGVQYAAPQTIPPLPVKSKEKQAANASKSSGKEKWVCKICGYIYDGDVPFEELPDTWTCPLCGAEKKYFEKRQI